MSLWSRKSESNNTTHAKKEEGKKEMRHRRRERGEGRKNWRSRRRK
jgi:hypothetical protein